MVKEQDLPESSVALMEIFAEPLVRLLQGIDRGGEGAGFACHQNLGAGNDHAGNLVAFLDLQLLIWKFLSGCLGSSINWCYAASLHSILSLRTSAHPGVAIPKSEEKWIYNCPEELGNAVITNQRACWFAMTAFI